jgi:hypothetical protein
LSRFVVCSRFNEIISTAGFCDNLFLLNKENCLVVNWVKHRAKVVFVPPIVILSPSAKNYVVDYRHVEAVSNIDFSYFLLILCI